MCTVTKSKNLQRSKSNSVPPLLGHRHRRGLVCCFVFASRSLLLCARCFNRVDLGRMLCITMTWWHNSQDSTLQESVIQSASSSLSSSCNAVPDCLPGLCTIKDNTLDLDQWFESAGERSSWGQLHQLILSHRPDEHPLVYVFARLYFNLPVVNSWHQLLIATTVSMFVDVVSELWHTFWNSGLYSCKTAKMSPAGSCQSCCCLVSSCICQILCSAELLVGRLESLKCNKSHGSHSEQLGQHLFSALWSGAPSQRWAVAVCTNVWSPAINTRPWGTIRSTDPSLTLFTLHQIMYSAVSTKA